MFFAAFLIMLRSILHRNLKHVGSERTLLYATPQCIGILSTFYIIQVTWLFDVQKQFQQCMQGSCVQSYCFLQLSLKMTEYAYADDHVVWQSATKINMMKSHFNLLQQIYFSTLIFRNSCDKHRILKDNSWICILNQYHKASGLKLCTARGMWCKYTQQIYFIISRWQRPSRSSFFLLGGGGLLLP